MARIRTDGEATNWEPVRVGQQRGEEVLVSVAEQRAAGVPSDDTVTLADQKKGESLPDLPGPLPEEESSPGTSSSTSGSRPDKSGSSAQATEQSDQSPARGAGNRSSQDRPAAQATSSTAPTTSGSTRRTGSSQRSRQSSSGD